MNDVSETPKTFKNTEDLARVDEKSLRFLTIPKNFKECLQIIWNNLRDSPKN